MNTRFQSKSLKGKKPPRKELMNLPLSPKKDALDALHAALEAANPQIIIKNNLILSKDTLSCANLKFQLSKFKRLFVIGGGKASAAMAMELENLLGDRITSGVINYPKYLKPPKSKRIRFVAATHPVPSEAGVRGVNLMLYLAGQKPKPDDFIICLISGGGSALMPKPIEGVTLKDKQDTTELLLKSGADIGEINCVRKHLSAFKGGRLAERLYPAAVLSLIISDVVGDRMDAVASGPTVPDPTTYRDAKAVLERYSIWEKVPARVRDHIKAGCRGLIGDTPKPGSKFFRNVHNVIIGSNKLSCMEASRLLSKRGYRTIIISTRLQGEARQVGEILGAILNDVRTNSLPMPSPCAIIAGGETTVKIKGNGIGGRNQEVALSAALAIQGLRDVAVASMGTDGVDGPTNAAGAISNGQTFAKAKKLRLDPSSYLENNDSHTFFKRVGGLVVTGPSGTNVNDLMIALAA